MTKASRTLCMRELILEDGKPQAGVFSGKSVRRTKPYINARNLRWQVTDPSGWIFEKYNMEEKIEA